MAQSIEEYTRPENNSPIGRCLKSFAFPSVADRLWTPFKFICFNPVISLGILLILYLVFAIIYFPLWILSFLLTSYGSFLVLLYAIHCLSVYITRNIAFPGGTIMNQKQISIDLMRRLSGFFEGMAVKATQYLSVLVLISQGKVPVTEILSLQYQLQQYTNHIESFPNMLTYLKDAFDEVNKQNEKALKPEEQRACLQFLKSIEDFLTSYYQVLEFLNIFFTHFQVQQFTQAKKEELMKIAKKCLKAADILRICAISMRPQTKKPGQGGGNQEQDDEEAAAAANGGGLNELFALLLSFRQQIDSFEKLAFPYMRSMIRHNYGGKIMQIKGAQDVPLEGMYVSAHEWKLKKTQKESASSSGPIATNESSSSTMNGASSPKRRTSGVSSANISSISTNTTTRRSSTSLSSMHDTNAPANLANSTANTSSPLGIVLFCNPNAGYYEVFSQMDIEKCWLGYYLQLGYDVFVYNYRGYGNSGGIPTPVALQADSLVVLQYIDQQYHPSRILLHGESIGGMMACYIAAHAPNTLRPLIGGLICDRTFASLDATASRLLFGTNLISYAMQYIVWWKTTNSTMNYMNVSYCPKLLIQVL
jgi:hypothetical protein